MTKAELLQIAKPILFNTEMVRAILEDRKTVTRRVIKKQPHPDMPSNHDYCRMPIFTGEGIKTLHYMDVLEQQPFRQIRYFESFAPYEKNDILYVRETWSEVETVNGIPFYIYRADHSAIYADSNHGFEKWHPSIHMPKEAARIWLKAKDVRVERLQEIDAVGCLQEGIESEYPHVLNGEEKRYAFSQLWNSTMKKSDIDTYVWDANPWVWVIEFEQLEPDCEV